MNYKYEIQPRKKLRRSLYNYSSCAYYFITICTNNRQCLFGDIYNNTMYLNNAGKMIHNTLGAINNTYVGWHTETHIVMPNHMHAILKLSKQHMNQPKSLGLPQLMRKIKSLTTVYYIKKVYLENWQPFHKHLWQRSYYEHVIRNASALDNIRNYIKQNPSKWLTDNYNPHL